jgi:lysophospholipase L1-like esterase
VRHPKGPSLTEKNEQKQHPTSTTGWRRHATGVTISLFFGFCALLSVLPLPENLRPIDIQSTEGIDRLWASISTPPKMYFVAFDNDQNQDKIDFDLDDNFDNDTEDEPSPSEGLATKGGNVAIPHDDLVAYSTKDGEGFKRTRYKPGPKAKRIWRGAQQLGAPGGFFENPCLSYESGACSRTAMDDFYRSLDEVYQKRPGSRAAVIALGNSLIASDHITDIVRQRLQENFGDAGLGFLLVDRLGKIAGRRARTGWSSGDWNVHTLIKEKPEYPHFGLFGAHHETVSANAKTVWRPHGETLAEIFWLDHPEAGAFYLEADGQFIGRITSDKPKLFRSRISEFEIPSQTKELVLIAENAKVIVDGVALSKNQPGVTFDTVGIPAATAQRYLNTNSAAFDIQLHARDPNLVVLMLGGNEVRDLAWKRLSLKTYSEQYEQLIKRLKKAAPGASCLGVSPIDVVRVTDGGRTILTRREIYDIIDAQKTVSIKNGCAYFNLFEAMGGSGSLSKLNDMGLLLADYVHPKGKGGDILGEIFARSLLKDYSNTTLPGRYTLNTKHGTASTIKDKDEVRKPKESPKQLKRGGPLDDFISKLLSLHKGDTERIAIGQLGGDLIAAQIFTDRLRLELAARFGDRGRGYISVGPFSRRLFKTGVVRHLEGNTEIVDGRKFLYGGAVSPAGLRARMKPGALFEVTFCAGCNEPMVLPQTILELAWLKTPDMGVADLYLDGEPLLSIHKNLVSDNQTDIHFTKVRASGLEHTLSVLVRDDEDFDHKNQGRLERNSFLRRGQKGPVHLLSVTAEIEQPGIVVDALGLPQMGPENMIRWRKDLIEQQINRRNYDLFVISWDRSPMKSEHKSLAQYQSAYIQSIKLLQEIQPDAACLVLGPTLQGSYAKSKTALAKLKETEQLHREMSQQAGCTYFSLAEAMGGLETIPQWEKAGWTLPGGKRLSENGYLHLADSLVKDLMLVFERERFERQRADAETGDGFFSRFAFMQDLFNIFGSSEAQE